MTNGSKADNGPTRELLVMFAGSQCVGILADEIETISDWRTPTPLPEAPAGVLGIVCIRGRMLTLLSANSLLGETSVVQGGDPAKSAKIVSLSGDEQVALAVDQVDESTAVAPSDLPDAGTGSLIMGVIKTGDRAISVVNAKELFATAMRGRERRRRVF